MKADARRIVRVGIFLLILLAGREILAQEKEPAAPLGPDRLAAIDRISADSLKGHLSFLASDLLEGRDTPSKGLDLAAEYIAAQFRRAGLEPVGDDGYFQTANWAMLESDRSSFVMEVKGSDSTLKLKAADVALTGARTFQIKDATLFKVDFKSYTELNRDELVGKVLLVEFPDTRNLPRGERTAAMTSAGIFRAWASSVKASALMVVSREPVDAVGQGNGFLFDPNAADTPERLARLDPSGRLPVITTQSPELAKILEANPVGPIALTVSTSLGEPVRRPVKLRNVVGLLRGSDPVLKDTCVMVTAHYDHIGIRGPEGTDRIFNGANDDGSGTVSVVEIASALATLKERPKRSILFVTFFGEEKGMLGSRYYGRNPIFPVEKTVADVNLEQVGRTDDTEGPQLLRASLTGFGYSSVSTAFVKAGEAEGVAVVKHPRNSDAFFGRSDNQALADLGVPAHTLCVAFVYPDYHGASDHWDKVDYANMARIDRMVARALLTLADDPEEPKWDESNPRAARYLRAWKARREK
jgi:hypothetical protein